MLCCAPRLCRLEGYPVNGESLVSLASVAGDRRPDIFG